MRVLIFAALLLITARSARAAASWSFDDGTVSVISKKDDSATLKEKLSSTTPLSKPIHLGHQDTVKVSLTAKDNGKAKRPHQAFILIQEPESSLEAPFALTMKDSGKGSISITQKDLPAPLLHATKPLKVSIVIGSLGSAQGLLTTMFELSVAIDAGEDTLAPLKPLRYGKQPEIHHSFRADPRSPPKIISLFFALAVLATLPAMVLGSLLLGANLNDLTKALAAAPLSHISLFGSIVAIEGVFFLYYTHWTLFQVLPVIGLLGAVTVLSGPKALGEVQGRRLAGQR